MDRSTLDRLYFKESLSAHQIAIMMSCSDNKVNYWLKKYNFQKRTIGDAIYIRSNPDGDPFTFNTPKNRDDMFLFGLGLGLYWGEGTKRSTTSVRLGNTDPDLVLAFLRFLNRIYNIKESKLRFGLQVFSDMSAQAALRFWSKKLNVSASQFGKVIVTPSRGVGNYREKTKHGVLTIYFSNKKLRDLLCQQIEELRSLR